MLSRKTKTTFLVRLMTEPDVPQIERIETVGSRNPWSAETLKDYANCGDSVCLVACRAGTTQVAGWLGYLPMEHTLHISRVVVDPLWRRKGIGSLLVDSLLAGVEVSGDLRPVEIFVPDVERETAKMLARMRFRSVTVYRNAADGGRSTRYAWDGGEDL